MPAVEAATDGGSGDLPATGGEPHAIDLLTAIHHPTSLPPPSSGPATIIIYLPRGPIHPITTTEDDAANTSTLRTSLPYTIAQLNYRTHAYPTPIHDVLAGYDWIREHLLPKRAISRVGRSEHVGRIAVVGELVGGSLATMLALTECRKGEPGVVAAAVNNPVVDWVSLDALDPPPSGMDTSPSLSLSVETLLQARDALFPTPQTYFDPFASPILFFRTPGAEVPVVKPEVDDLTYLSMIEREDFYKQQMMLSGISSSSDYETSSTPSPEPGPKKRASRLFPSKSLNLSLPSLYISAGNASPVEAQSLELFQAMRKSVIRQQKANCARGSGFGRKVLQDYERDQMEDEEMRMGDEAEETANRKVLLQANEGEGLWDRSPQGRRRMEGAVAWLMGKLAGR